MDQKDVVKLVNALNCLAKLSKPVVFKYISSAGVTEGEMKEMFINIQLLADKYGTETTEA